MDTLSNIPPDLDTPPTPTPPAVMKLPEVKSISHARKMASILFGPLARVWVRKHADDKGVVITYEVGVERAGNRKVFAIDEALQVALQKAVESVSDYERVHGNLPRNVFPQFSAAAKPVLTRRMKRVIKQVGVILDPATQGDDIKEVEALVSHLRPNDVSDFEMPLLNASACNYFPINDPAIPNGLKDYISSLRTAVGR